MNRKTHSDPKRDHLAEPELKVADVMRSDFRSCNPSTSIAEVATALRVSGGAILPVTTAQVPEGVVTEHGLASALAEHGGDLSRLTAADLMDRGPATVSISTPADEALEHLAGSSAFLLAVNADGLLKGIVTLAEFGPHLTEHGRAYLAVRLGPLLGSAPAEEAREADPSAEIKSSKSQAQPHPWDSPTREHPAPIPLVSPSDLLNPMLKACDVMTHGPRTCSPRSTALEAVMIFRDANCGFVPIVEEGRLVGVLTDRDVALALSEHEVDLAGRPVEELMTREVVTIVEDSSLDSVLETMETRGLRRLPVVDSHGQLGGVLSLTDLSPHLSERALGRAVGRFFEKR